MTAIEAYILSKKIALGAVSGIQNITLSPTGQLIFQFKDGSSATWQIPLPQDGQDGLSIIDVKIDDNNHLICTLSDNSIVDAGELPGGTGGGLIKVANFLQLQYPGDPNTLYMTLDTESVYYWDETNNLYKPVVTNGVKNEDLTSVDLLTSSIEFNGIKTTFDLPVDNVKLNVYVNGVYLTEDIDYTIDRNVTPNTITFLETWEETDSCTITWIKGNILSPEELEKVGFDQLKSDITSALNVFAFIRKADLSDPILEVEELAGTTIIGAAGPIPVNQRPHVKVAYITDLSESNHTKVVGLAVTSYNTDTDKFSVIPTIFGEGGKANIDDASLAKKEDIDKLFGNIDDIDITNSTLATKQDIDNLFSNMGDITIDSDLYATKGDIDNLFSAPGEVNPDTSSLASKQDIDNLFS